LRQANQAEARQALKPQQAGAGMQSKWQNQEAAIARRRTAKAARADSRRGAAAIWQAAGGSSET